MCCTSHYWSRWYALRGLLAVNATLAKPVSMHTTEATSNVDRIVDTLAICMRATSMP